MLLLIVLPYLLSSSLIVYKGVTGLIDYGLGFLNYS